MLGSCTSVAHWIWLTLSQHLHYPANRVEFLYLPINQQMAKPKPPQAAVQIVAIFSRYESVLDWAMQKISDQWGEFGLVSPRFDHNETNYYEAEMGTGLRKQFLVLASRYDPAWLPQSKLQSNAWEEELAASQSTVETRPLNIDPGYLTLTKLVLASAKDRAHRIYLRDGIYAEECLYYLDQRWNSRPWTYPDYQREDFQRFFTAARVFLKNTI